MNLTMRAAGLPEEMVQRVENSECRFSIRVIVESVRRSKAFTTEGTEDHGETGKVISVGT